MNLKKLNKKKQKVLLFFLFIFSIYSALSIGLSWDEGFHSLQGKITLDYLFSLGKINKDLFYREYYSPIYWSLQYFLTNIFPFKYQAEAGHLVNLFFSICTIFGISKIGKELFNKDVGKIIFLILFFYPVFFGHMSFNSKDTILAFCHVWIFLLSIRYLKKQNKRDNTNHYALWIGLLAATATGIQLIFLSSLLPIFLFIIAEIFLIKKIIKNNFVIKKFLFDLMKCFLTFYFILVFFWIDVHANIFILPISKVLQMFSSSYVTGWPFNLVNGEYYLSAEIPANYLFLNFVYKSPEYFLISYLIFIILIFTSRNFFHKNFKFFTYKILLIAIILIFPNILLLLTPFPIYDGIRLFLWTVPYLCIIPGVTIYYLVKNSNFIKSKLTLLSLSIFIIYFLFNFFSITPYQYTYLNLLNGESENRYKKFENDYWGSSVKELIELSSLKKNKKVLIATCGVNPDVVKHYFKKKGYVKYNYVDPQIAKYIIMTNRTILNINAKNKAEQITNCFDMFKGKDISIVKRNNLVLSVIRKIY